MFSKCIWVHFHVDFRVFRPPGPWKMMGDKYTINWCQCFIDFVQQNTHTKLSLKRYWSNFMRFMALYWYIVNNAYPSSVEMAVPQATKQYFWCHCAKREGTLLSFDYVVYGINSNMENYNWNFKHIVHDSKTWCPWSQP